MKQQFVCALIALASLAPAARVFAEGVTLGEAKPPVETTNSVEQTVINVGDSIAKGVDKTADFLDVTLAGKRYTDKPNTSSLDISQMVSYLEGGQWRKSTDFGLNMRLPNIEKRWQLRFTSYDEEAEQRDLTQQRIRTRPRPRDYGAGVFFFQKVGRLKTTFQPRFQLKNPLEAIYTLRFQITDLQFGKYKVDPRVEFYGDPNKGTGEFVQIGISRELSRKWVVEFSNTEEYRSLHNLFSTQHELSLDYAVGKNQGLGTAVTLACNNKTEYNLNAVTYSIGYGLSIYPQRLKVGASPFIVFGRDYHFKGHVGASLTADLIF